MTDNQINLSTRLGLFALLVIYGIHAAATGGAA